MKLIKLSQSFNKKINHIDNYFVLDFGNNNFKIGYSPFFIESETFRKQFNQQNLAKNIPSFTGKIFHFCYDSYNNRLYLPESTSETESQEIENGGAGVKIKMYLAKMRHEHFFNIGKGKIIAGNPNSTFKIRNIASFFSAASFIKNNIKSQDVPLNLNLVVVEANLSSMPKTANYLKISTETESCFVHPNVVVPFIKTIGGKNSEFHQQIGPFILINTSPNIKISESEKNRIVVENYHEYFSASTVDKEDLQKDSNLFTIKYRLLLGWSAEEICKNTINADDVLTINHLRMVGSYLIQAGLEIEESGHKNPFRNYYYYIIERTKQFPYPIPKVFIGDEIIDKNQNAFIPLVQNENANAIMQFVTYDWESNLLTLRSPLYIDKKVCKNIFFTNNITIVSYLADEKKIQSDINIKSQKTLERSVKILEKDIKEDQGLNQNQSINFEQKSYNKNDVTNMFTKRKISDFYLAAEKIKILCEREELARGKEVPFEDLNVYLGPISAFVPGMGGGWLEARGKDLNAPIVSLPGLQLYPRDIVVDTINYQRISDMYGVLIHEYTHDLNWRVGITEGEYQKAGKTPESIIAYLEGEDETDTHMKQAMEWLEEGWNKDQIIQKFFNGVPNYQYLSIANKYNQIVDNAIKKLEEYHKIEEKQKEEEIMKQLERDIEKIKNPNVK